MKKIVGKKILEYLREEEKEYPVNYQYLEPNKSCISVNSVSGSARINEDILGNYESLYPFSIILRVMPEHNLDRLQAEQKLNDLGEYLEDKTNKIQRNSLPSLIAVTESGINDYQIIIQYKEQYYGKN